VTTLVLVGGFLGAGKTTLLLAAAERLKAAGKRAGVILNDQGAHLVDTEFAAASGFAADEVPGGCFCCRFSDFASRAARLSERAPDIILAEPVGSCTDLAATVLRPLRERYRARFRVAPLTVLVDPERELADADLDYLFRKQIAEADIVLYSKADKLRRPDSRCVSAHTGEGLDDWLAEVLSSDCTAQRRLALDYRRYARAERALGWLNWHAALSAHRALTPAAVAGTLLERMDALLNSVVHLKVFVQGAGGYVKAGICRNGEQPAVDGRLDAPPSRRHRIVLNARAAAPPGALDAAVGEAALALPGRVRVEYKECFRPAAPKPEHRLQEVPCESPDAN
jgi:hypothetical protein